MRLPLEPLRFLDPEEMATIHRNALRILAETGMQIHHAEALEYLRAAGCRVDHDRKIVHFPEDLVQKNVDKMRADFATREYPERMSVRYSHIRFKREPFRIHEDFTVNAGGFCVFIYDLEGARREATLQDTRDALKLVAQLDQITHSGLPVAAQDVPLPIRPIAMAAELVKHTDKLGGIETFNAFDVEYICRIGEIVRGSLEELKKRPVLIGYAEARTPLCIDEVMCEIFLAYVKRGMPQSLDCMPNAGATAPMHPAGAIALGIAESLGGLSLAYAVDPDACVSIDIVPSFMDMSSGLFKYAGAERISLIGARVQMISEHYGCPSGVHGGKTDACALGTRCGLEKGITALMPVLCGAVGIGTVGHLENAVTFSPAQLVIDNEVVRYVRRAVQGFEVTDETINVELIDRVGPGGAYLQEPETLAQFREFADLSTWFRVAPWGGRHEVDENRRWEKMAVDKARELLANEIDPPLTDDQVRAVDEVVAEATAKLQEQGRL